jgi:hypothetical protein
MPYLYSWREQAMKNRRLRTLLLVASAVVVLALTPIPASAGPCATKCGAGFYRGTICYTCCTCCVFNDGSIDCICSTECDSF